VGRTSERRVSPLVLLSLALVLFTGLHLAIATLPSAKKLRSMRAKNHDIARELIEERARRARLEDRLEGLREDPYVVESELRRTHGMMRPDEIVLVESPAIRD
jgi:cell division protein FtsB